MNPIELELWLKENNLVTSEANKRFFDTVTHGLREVTGNDSEGNPIMCGTREHCVQSFNDTITITGASSVFEIGLNLGYGSAVMLSLGMVVHSIDISRRIETSNAARFLSSRYHDSFSFECVSSGELLKRGGYNREFDLAFIDGGHYFEDVMTDIELCWKMRIPNLLFDDWYPEYGPGVQDAITASGLKVRAIFGNMCLCSEI